MGLTVAIVDDEPLAREDVRAVLSGSDVEIVAECGTGAAAVEAIEARDPDLVILDIELTDFNGFEVLGMLSEARRPAVIFVTAYADRAVRAFDVHAVDYVVKPYREERLREAVGRARARIEAGTPERLWERLESVVDQLDTVDAGGSAGENRELALATRRWARRILVGEPSRRHFLPVEDIDWLESDSNYVRIHAGEEVHLVRSSLSSLMERLDPGQFLRIHRGTVVNLDRVQEIQPWFAGRWLAILRDGTQLRVSRGYRDGLLHLTL